MCFNKDELMYKELNELGCKDLEDYVELKCMEQPEINYLEADTMVWEEYD